jgi:peptide/nickel transport system substrate-binding protein
MVMGLTFAAACEGPPARPKPWRHVPDVAPAADAAPRESADQVRAAEARARTLRIRLAAEPRTLNLLADADREALQIAEDTVYETLLVHSPEGYTPRLAESFRVVGGSQIRITLRKGVSFDGGRPFTAVDAQASIDAARRPSSRAPRLRAVLADVAAAEIWGPRDLRIVLRRPNGYALRALAEVPMLPASELGADVPSGTGPYRVARWERGAVLRLERRDGYWGQPPPIAAIEFAVIPDAAQALTLARRGEIDVVPALIPEHWPEQAISPGVAAVFAPMTLAPPRFVGVALNARRPPFDDRRVRRAAAMLVDRARLAREGWRGLARPAAGPIWPGGLGDADAPPPPPHDPARAMQLLEEAGWKSDRDGVRARGADKLRIVFVGVGAQSDPERDLIVGGLRRGGFGVEVRVVEPAAYFARLRDRDFDAAIIDYRGRVDEDLAPLLASGGARNHGGLSSPPVDATCAALQRVWEPGARRPLLTQLAALLAAEMPFIPLVAPTPRGLVARRLGGVAVSDGWLTLRGLTLPAPAAPP